MVIKMKPYEGVNKLVMFVDYLLLKVVLFKQIIYYDQIQLFPTLSVNLFSIWSFRSLRFKPVFTSNFIISLRMLSLIEHLWIFTVSSLIYILLIAFKTKQVQFYKFYKVFLFAQLYNAFYLLFFIWKYQKIFYFFLLDFLSGCALVVATNVLVNSKGYSFLFVTFIYTYKYYRTIRIFIK